MKRKPTINKPCTVVDKVVSQGYRLTVLQPPCMYTEIGQWGKWWMHTCMLSHVWLFAPPWTVACQAPQSMEFSMQEYWSRLLFPAPGDLPDPGIEPASFASPVLAGRFFTTVPSRKLKWWIMRARLSLLEWKFTDKQGDYNDPCGNRLSDTWV